MDEGQGFLGTDKDNRLYHSTVSEYKEDRPTGDDVFPLGEEGREGGGHTRRNRDDEERDEGYGRQTE